MLEVMKFAATSWHAIIFLFFFLKAEMKGMPLFYFFKAEMKFSWNDMFYLFKKKISY